MKYSILAGASAAILMLGSSAFAQKVPDPAHPAPANPTSTSGAPTQALAKTGRSMDSGAGMTRTPGPGGGNPDNANGGNGPGGRY